MAQETSELGVPRGRQWWVTAPEKIEVARTNLYVSAQGIQYGTWINRGVGYASGSTIQQPAYVIEYILRNVMGVASADIDMDSFDAVGNYPTGTRNGWKIAASIQATEKASEYLREASCTPSRYFVYVLVKDIPSAHQRVLELDKHKLDPFAQPYIDFSGKNNVTKEQKRFARWVNHKAIFRSVKYEDYK